MSRFFDKSRHRFWSTDAEVTPRMYLHILETATYNRLIIIYMEIIKRSYFLCLKLRKCLKIILTETTRLPIFY